VVRRAPPRTCSAPRRRTSIALRVCRWCRERRETIHCAAALLGITALFGVQSALVWHALAGSQILMTQSGEATPPHREASAGLQPARGELHAGHDDTPGPIPHVTTTVKPPTTISGTALAAAIILFMTGIALLAARAVLPRLQRRQIISPSTDASTGDEVTRSGDLHSEDAQDPRDTQDTGDGDGDENEEPRSTLADEPTGAERDGDLGNAVTSEGPEVAGATGRSGHGDTELDDQLPLAPPVRGADTRPEEPSETTCPTVSGERQATRAGSVILYDRRLVQRVVFESQARLQWENYDVVCLTQDISMRGTRLRFPADLPAVARPTMGAYAQLTLMLDGELAVFRARVGWQSSEEVGPVLGLHFLDLHKRHEELLQPIVLRGKPV